MNDMPPFSSDPPPFENQSPPLSPRPAPGSYYSPPPPLPPPMPGRPPKRRSRFLSVFLGLLMLLFFGAVSLIVLFGLTFGGGVSRIANRIAGGIGKRNIALLRIEGPIMPGTRYDYWIKTLRAIGDDPEIKGVLLRINSPGGTVGSSQEIYDEILRLRNDRGSTPGKRVYISMGDLAASGAYYISAAADRIIANRGTLTGSIGVISTMYRVEELAEKAGVDVEVVKTGRFKDSGSPFRPLTDDEKKMFDFLLNSAYDQFVNDILSQRQTPLSKAHAAFQETDWALYQFEKPENGSALDFLHEIADGRVYTGEQALKLGLVDELGAMNHALSRLAQDLKIEGRPAVYEPRQQMDFFDFLTSKVEDALPKGWAHSTLQYRMIPF